MGILLGFVYDFTGFNEVYVGFMGVDRLSGAETMVFGMFTQSIAMHKEWLTSIPMAEFPDRPSNDGEMIFQTMGCFLGCFSNVQNKPDLFHKFSISIP